MVAAEGDIAASAVICLGYPLKVCNTHACFFININGLKWLFGFYLNYSGFGGCWFDAYIMNQS